jgi:hypothetical protein
MGISIRTIVLGLLLASGATTVGAEAKTPAATPPAKSAPTQQSIPMDLALPTSTFLAGPPATTLQAPLQTPPIGAAGLSPAAATAAGPVDVLQAASEEVKRVARWVIDSGDNNHLPFLLIDKVNAQVYAFSPAGQLRGVTPALLGLARGDRLLAPNTATMEQMPPQVRITPAGRFVSKLAIDSHGKELLVLDYDASISLHAVIKGTPKERRAERLNSATADDNRISFGCINVPEAFYSTVVSPTFTGTKGIVYVLPETGPASALFVGMDPVGAPMSGALQGPSALDARAGRTVPAAVAK